MCSHGRCHVKWFIMDSHGHVKTPDPLQPAIGPTRVVSPFINAPRYSSMDGITHTAIGPTNNITDSAGPRPSPGPAKRAPLSSRSQGTARHDTAREPQCECVCVCPRMMDRVPAVQRCYRYHRRTPEDSGAPPDPHPAPSSPRGSTRAMTNSNQGDGLSFSVLLLFPSLACRVSKIIHGQFFILRRRRGAAAPA